jgi:hypothetical protein
MRRPPQSTLSAHRLRGVSNYHTHALPFLFSSVACLSPSALARRSTAHPSSYPTIIPPVPQLSRLPLPATVRQLQRACWELVCGLLCLCLCPPDAVSALCWLQLPSTLSYLHSLLATSPAAAVAAALLPSTVDRWPTQARPPVSAPSVDTSPRTHANVRAVRLAPVSSIVPVDALFALLEPHLPQS